MADFVGFDRSDLFVGWFDRDAARVAPVTEFEDVVASGQVLFAARSLYACPEDAALDAKGVEQCAPE